MSGVTGRASKKRAGAAEDKPSAEKPAQEKPSTKRPATKPEPPRRKKK